MNPNNKPIKKSPIQESKKEIKEICSEKNIVASFAMNDVDYWRKKNNLPPNAKIFIIIGGYHALRRALLNRGEY